MWHRPRVLARLLSRRSAGRKSHLLRSAGRGGGCFSGPGSHLVRSAVALGERSAGPTIRARLVTGCDRRHPSHLRPVVCPGLLVAASRRLLRRRANLHAEAHFLIGCTPSRGQGAHWRDVSLVRWASQQSNYFVRLLGGVSQTSSFQSTLSQHTKVEKTLIDGGHAAHLAARGGGDRWRRRRRLRRRRRRHRQQRRWRRRWRGPAAAATTRTHHAGRQPATRAQPSPVAHAPPHAHTHAHAHTHTARPRARFGRRPRAGY